MKILCVADEESTALWDYYRPGMLREYDLILSSGDLKAEYLRFLVTMARCPLLYVHGNHDGSYKNDPPEGCDDIDGKLMIYRGLRILGLGGSNRYSQGEHQYTEQQMEKRIRKLKRAIRLAGGVDIVLTHAAPRNCGDAENYTHLGFEAFLKLIEEENPQYLLHGHVHMNYDRNIQRVCHHAGTPVINCCGKQEVEITPRGDYQPLRGWKRRYADLFVKNLIILDM